ncbi:hypothetical protein J3R30DRAFT_3290194 [Lentinula aciculospora]|uniref:DUF4050 domain-containing protein n=1 Tax=Lentinula aciculospora TaxID=153920 RepID=A0A9W9AAJ5_9AGAR|nr:hypothetical protein J3R30DRAFT_3290194 [Lentinula aciculospora]
MTTNNRKNNALNNELHGDPYFSHNSFQRILEASELPPPGPLYYAARRALWLKSPNNNNAPRILPPSTSRLKLENLLNTPDAVYNDELWEGGIQKVWKGLSGGASLKRRLPMNLVIKIVHCAWIRDETWPSGAVAPDPDDILVEEAQLPEMKPDNNI